MKNTFGASLSVTLFGESHGEEIGVILDGLSPGIKLDHDNIKKNRLVSCPLGKLYTALTSKYSFIFILTFHFFLF